MPDFRDLARDPEHKPRFEKLLRLAAARGDVDLVVERLSWGIDPNCTTPKNGRTPLMVNVRGSSPASGVVRALLQAGADATLLDIRGLTALDYANRKLAHFSLRAPKPPRKSSSLDENNQLILSEEEIAMFDETRRTHPDIAKDFINGYLKDRLKAARRLFNDPGEIEKIIDLLQGAGEK